jgi:hypothetical protein
MAEVETLERGGGNDIVNFIYEAGLCLAVYDKNVIKEDEESDAAARKEFIRMKYQDLRYFDPELYRTQIPEDDHHTPAFSTSTSGYQQSNGVLVKVKPTKKLSKRSQSYEQGSSQSHSKTPTGLPRKNRSFHGQTLRADSDHDEMELEKEVSSRRTLYSLPGHLAVTNNTTHHRSNLSNIDRSNTSQHCNTSRTGKKKKAHTTKDISDSSRGRSTRKGGFGCTSTRRDRSASSSSKYVSIDDADPSPDDLGYGMDASLQSTSSTHSQNSNAFGIRMPKREKRRSSTASRYKPMNNISPPSHDDLGYGSSTMDSSLGSISSCHDTKRRGSTASTASVSLPSSFSDTGSGRWEASSQLLSGMDSSCASDRWNPDSSQSSLDRWASNSSSQASSKIIDRWGNISSHTNTTMDQSNQTHMTEATLPRCNRRRRSKSPPHAAAEDNTSNKGNAVAPRMPRRLFSDGSGSDTDANITRQNQDRAALESIKPKRNLRRMSLPSFASSNNYEDEDSILNQYNDPKLQSEQAAQHEPKHVPVRRSSLGMKKEKAGPKYGMKMGYGFEDASIGSDSDREKRREKKPSKMEPEPVPTLGTFLEKTQEAVPNRILGGRSLGSGTKSSNEDIVGIGPSAKLRSSWKKSREKRASNHKPLGSVSEQEEAGATTATATLQKKLSSSSALVFDENGGIGSRENQKPQRLGLLADHLNASKNDDMPWEAPASDNKSLGGGSTALSLFTGCSFGSISTSSEDEMLCTMSGLTKTEIRNVRRSLMSSTSDESSLAGFSLESESVGSDDELRRAFTLAILKASNQNSTKTGTNQVA